MFGPLFNLVYDEVRRVWCFRWLLLATSAALFIAGAIVIFALPDVYQASGQIYVRKGTPLTAAADGVLLSEDNFGSPALIQKTMLNDATLKKVVARAYPGQIDDHERNAAMASLRGAQIKTEGDEGFVDFELKDADPVRVQKLTQALMRQFISENVTRSSQDIEKASSFLDAQIAEHEKQLVQSQAEMDSFRRAHPRAAVMTPLAPVADSGAGGSAADVAGARAELAAALGRNRGAAVATPQDGAIAQAEGRLAGMLTQYTEQHPDVIAARREIASLKAQRAQYLTAAAAQPAAVDPSVAVAQARLAAAQARARRGGGVAASAAAPDLSGQWGELRRRHDTLTQNYQRLIDRREGAKVSQAVYGSEDSGKYTITRDAVVPGSPSGPDRKMFLAAVAVLALGAGVAAAYLRATIASIFVSPRELEDAFQLPVIGTVSWEPAWHVAKTKRSTPALPAR